MNATWITLAVTVVLGLTKLLTYFLGDDRRLRILKEKEYELEEKLREAAARLDTVTMADTERELFRVRSQIADLNRK